MVKIKGLFISICFLYAFMATLIVAQGESTSIISIRIQNKEILKRYWNELSFTTNDTVVFNFIATSNKIEQNKILYHIFLNGKVINLENPRNDIIILSNLVQGNYILKIQGYTNEGWEAKPVVQQFLVNKLFSVEKNEKDYNAIYSTILFYGIPGFASLFLLLLLVIVIKRITEKWKVKKSTKTGKDNTNKSKFEVNEKKMMMKNSILVNRIDELTNIINHLKKEFKKIDEHNKSLKEQVQELKSYITNLETANAQLIEQKERLAESKLKLEELHSHKEKLFATTVHDIKNPAAAIKGYVELLEGYDLNAFEQHEIMQFLADTSGRILELAQKMSVVIATDISKPELNFQKSSIKHVIDRVCNQNLATAKRKNITIINNTSADCPEILFDEDKIFEVVDNLISNAIKFSKEKSIIQLRSYFNDNKIFVEVIDNGTGLTSADMPKLFTKGAVLSSKPTAGEESSGLGLWIAKNIIEEHNGRIWASSKVGIGSTFTFELPINKNEQNK